MSEKAQEVRRKRLEHMRYLRESAEIAFDFILNDLDEKTSKNNYTPTRLYIDYYSGTPRNDLEPYCAKSCDGVKIDARYYNLFFEILEKMFNAEEGYTATFMHDDGKVSYLIVNIDIV